MRTVAFIGTGNMGSPIAKAACESLSPAEVVLTNRTAAKADNLARQLGCVAVLNNEAAVRSAKYIMLGIKPQFFRDLAQELNPVLRACHEAGEDKVLISMAAGLQLDTLQEFFSGAGYEIPILRIMPNTCAAIGKGSIALCARENEDPVHVTMVKKMLLTAGWVEQLPERLMDSFSALAGCGPAFVYPYIEALADGGVMAGIPRDQAMRYAAQTVLGAAAMVLESGKHPGQLKDEVCSPAGSTIEGVAALERHGLRAAAIDAVVSAWSRNKALGKQ